MSEETNPTTDRHTPDSKDATTIGEETIKENHTSALLVDTDTFPNGHAFEQLSDTALTIFLLSLLFSCAHGTNGLVPRGPFLADRKMRGASRQDTEAGTAELVDAELWGRDGETYRFHDWNDYQSLYIPLGRRRDGTGRRGPRSGQESLRTSSRKSSRLMFHASHMRWTSEMAHSRVPRMRCCT